MHVPIDDPNADTEWYFLYVPCLRSCLITRCRNDILRKHKIIPEKPPSPTPIIQEALLKAQKLAYENRLEDKDLDELKELEDEEDDAFLAKYRSI